MVEQACSVAERCFETATPLATLPGPLQELRLTLRCLGSDDRSVGAEPRSVWRLEDREEIFGAGKPGHFRDLDAPRSRPGDCVARSTASAGLERQNMQSNRQAM